MNINTTASAVSRKLSIMGFQREDIQNQTGFWVESNEMGVRVTSHSSSGRSAAKELENSGYIIDHYLSGAVVSFYASDVEIFYVVGKVGA